MDADVVDCDETIEPDTVSDDALPESSVDADDPEAVACVDELVSVEASTGAPVDGVTDTSDVAALDSPAENTVDSDEDVDAPSPMDDVSPATRAEPLLAVRSPAVTEVVWSSVVSGVASDAVTLGESTVLLVSETECVALCESVVAPLGRAVADSFDGATSLAEAVIAESDEAAAPSEDATVDALDVIVVAEPTDEDVSAVVSGEPADAVMDAGSLTTEPSLDWGVEASAEVIDVSAEADAVSWLIPGTAVDDVTLL